MKYLFKSIIVVLLVFSISQLKAQTNDTYFTLTSENVNISGQDIAISSTITKTSSALVWTQNNTDTLLTSSFTITSSSGNWNQSTVLGTLTYNMTIEGYPCTLTLMGEQTGITAILSLLISSEDQENLAFNIDSISYQ